MASGDLQELIVRIKADTASLDAGLKEAATATKATTTAMTTAFNQVTAVLGTFGLALGAAEIINFGKEALNAADDLYIMSQRTGIAASTLSALNIPLKQNGSSVDEFSSSMKFMSRNIELASEGNTELLKRFDDIGLSVNRLKQLTPEQQFYAIASALGDVTDQGKLSADVLALMGRGAAGLIPIIRETKGNLQDFVDVQKQMGNALTDAEIKKVHEFEDAWTEMVERLKIKTVELFAFFRTPILLQNKDDPTRYGINYGVEFGPPAPKFTPNAKGNNNDVAGSDAAKKQQDINKTLTDYIQKQKDANTVAGQGSTEQAGLAAYYKIVNDLMDKGLTLQEAELKIGPDRKEQIEQLANAHADLIERMREAQRTADEMKRSFADALTNLAFNFKNAGQAASDFFKTIAENVFNKSISTPLSDAIVGAFQKPDNGIFTTIGKLVGISGTRAAGGPVSGGNSYLVGENGPEIFTPGSSGGITPNSKIGGGTTVQVTQVFNMQPGLVETVGAAIRNAAPAIASMAHASVFQAIQNGGSEARIVGARS